MAYRKCRQLGPFFFGGFKAFDALLRLLKKDLLPFSNIIARTSATTDFLRRFYHPDMALVETTKKGRIEGNDYNDEHELRTSIVLVSIQFMINL